MTKQEVKIPSYSKQIIHRFFCSLLSLLLAFSPVAEALASLPAASHKQHSISQKTVCFTTNTYDSTGMRVRKVAGSTTSRFVRGLGAELLQEITGSTRRNYIYANGVPVAQLNGTTLHYLHTDQRGAPVKATNASKTVRWSTRYEPFGATTGLTNPGSLVMNLRLPGQYADAESGLYDNGFRTYNPQTGRYLQSDPIGLAGGSNTYGYVGGMPFAYVDPLGLTKIEFDRYSQLLHVDPEIKGRSPYSMPATSGRESCNCTERDKDRGPIPKGSYSIYVNMISNPNWFMDFLRSTFRGDWGDWRVPLIPNPGTETYNRSGFFLHGGWKAGSAGCIDFGGGVFGDTQSDILLGDILADPDGIVPVTVK